MTRIDLAVPTPDGTCPATLHAPDSGGPRPGVILFPDAAGVRETFRAMADRLAGLGYAVLLPDVYYRAGDWTPFDADTVMTDPVERARLGELAGAVTAATTATDTGAFLDALGARDEVRPGPVGTTGYCMGGRSSLVAAAHHPDRIGAAASFHGGGLAAEDDPHSPHRLADRLAATTVHVAAARDDAFFPADQYARLEAALVAAGVPHTIGTYPAEHGFAVPDNPTFDADAHERHWTDTARLFDGVLG